MSDSSIKTLISEFWDVVVIGSGIGGSTVAYSAAQNGKRVLVISKPTSSGQLPLWKDRVYDVLNGKNEVPFLGDGIGGSSRFYGMVMERLEESDFVQTELGSWPGSLSEWSPYFERAEAILGANKASPRPEWTPFFKKMQKQGIQIDPLNLSCRLKDNCRFCQSTLCDNDCKIDAFSGPLQKALKTQNAFLLEGKAIKLKENSGHVVAVEIHTSEGLATVRGQQFVLATGALRTPSILSGTESLGATAAFSRLPAIGCYFMRHFIDLYVVKWPELKKHSPELKKAIHADKVWGSKSLYFENGIKLGSMQAFGSFPEFNYVWEDFSGSNPWVKYIPGGKIGFKLALDHFCKHPLLATIVEDAPSQLNRVMGRSDGGVDIYYALDTQSRVKISYIRSRMKHILGQCYSNILKEAENNFRLAHACGTCRMGLQTQTSVVDYYGKVHHSDNLWIADSSVFPTSTGKNPALTIAAHALRLADKSLLKII